ncbi:hypothetical protein M404DRAFT_992114 [Pisolithus tinctorius Marx 270]|uniref:Uncharacterized protein n=1 Tax=Pisolithus tinctorius Marx 270 TaxID=870435 RepID=A0A0C3KWK3_PISTI|nr:hypothetical protein M404DRAFT_992114 [Pisolithus tinctorius Marx 270]
MRTGDLFSAGKERGRKDSGPRLSLPRFDRLSRESERRSSEQSVFRLRELLGLDSIKRKDGDEYLGRAVHFAVHKFCR